MRLKRASLKTVKKEGDVQLEVTYTERLSDGSNKKTSEEYNRQAHPDLGQSFQNLAIHWAILCGYVSVKSVKNIATPKEELTDGIHISGISIKTGDDEGVVITGYKKLETGKAVNINTPFQRYTESEESAYKFTDDLIERVERANKEVTAYLDGSKVGTPKQPTLGFDAEGNQGTPAAGVGETEAKGEGNDDITQDTDPDEETDPIPPGSVTEEIAQRLEDKEIWENGQRPKV